MPRKKDTSEENVADSIIKLFAPKNHAKKRKVRVEEEVVKVGKNVGVMRTIFTASGKMISRTISPLMIKFERKDVAQVFIGSLLLASPFMVTEEVWRLGQEIPIVNAIAIMCISLFSIITLFYYTRYQRVRTLEGKIPKGEFVKRVFGTYMITLLIVGILLTTLDKAPWYTDTATAMKRTIIVSLPASLGGAVADLIK